MGFTFNGVTTESMGIVVNSIQSYVKPQVKTEVIEVEGKDGAEVKEYGYAPYVLKAKITLLDLTKIDDVIAWLNGSGQLIIDEDDSHCRNVKIISTINYDFFVQLKSATVEFYVYDPFRYLVFDLPQTITTFPNSITNTGNVYSKPLLTIIGSGSVSITINGTTFSYNFPLTESVTIDCEKMDAYYTGLLRNQYMSGYFPVLKVGSNAISVTGTVTSIKFEKYSRWL